MTITDRPIEVNLREIAEVKKRWTLYTAPRKSFGKMSNLPARFERINR